MLFLQAGIVLLLLLLLHLTTGRTMTWCFKCTYTRNGKAESGGLCKDPFNSTKVPTTHCVGGCMKVKGITNNQELIVRGCWTTLGKHRKCVSNRTKKESFTGTVNCCHGDRCNNGKTYDVEHNNKVSLLLSFLTFICTR